MAILRLRRLFVTPGLRRMQVTPALWSYVNAGYSGSAAYREIVRVGLGYSRNTFWQDWQAATGKGKVKGIIRQTPSSQLVPAEHIPDLPMKARKRFQYTIGMESRDARTGAVSPHYLKIQANSLLSEDEVIAEASKMLASDLWYKPEATLSNPWFEDVVHHRGWKW